MITAWKDRHRSVSGHQGAYDMREIVNAILYQGRTGCQWAYLPHDLPQKSATYYYFAAWRDDGTDQGIHELLRCQVRERARTIRGPDPGGAGHPECPRGRRGPRHHRDAELRRQDGSSEVCQPGVPAGRRWRPHAAERSRMRALCSGGGPDRSPD
ncbi:transposase [Streptomyces sp. ZSW22]|nr:MULTISPECIES: transposase [unclassified Streptomyces]MDN3249095.1 transposase [Streptomyces sp. ZSW22]MDN3257538.1 transposase [Streptomyces sp. MA25(2023)]